MKKLAQLDITKAIDAASGLAQGLETQDLEDNLTTTNEVLDDAGEDEEDNSGKS